MGIGYYHSLVQIMLLSATPSQQKPQVGYFYDVAKGIYECFVTRQEAQGYIM